MIWSDNLIDAKQARHQLIFALHFFFHQEEGHTIGLERAAAIHILRLGLQLWDPATLTVGLQYPLIS